MKSSMLFVVVSAAVVVACTSKTEEPQTGISDLPAAPAPMPGGDGTGSAPPATGGDAPAPSDDAGGAAQEAGAGSDAGTGAGAQNLQCCVNGSCWICPTQAALTKCVGFDLGACFDACADTDVKCFTDCGNKAGNGFRDPSDCKVKP